MTPFDPVALLAMLLTFYPVVGPAALLQARAERPDYFASGEIRGTKGDKLWLPDGRKFDLIFATGSPAQHWQVLDVTIGDAGGAGGDVFALEAGPLAPIDESAWPEPLHEAVFVPLVADAIAQLAGADAALVTAHLTLTAAASPDALEAAYFDTIGGSDQELGGSRALLDRADPSDILGTTNAHGGAIDANEAQFSETPPDDIPDVPALPFPEPPDIQNPNPDTQS